MKGATYFFVAFLSCLVLSSCKKEPAYSNPSYAVGTVESFDESVLRRTGATYHFRVNGILHTNTTRKAPINMSLTKGDKFMVAYEAGRMERNILIFADKVVNDSADSAKFVSKYIFDPPY